MWYTTYTLINTVVYGRRVAKARTLLLLIFSETASGRAVAVVTLALIVKYENGVMMHTCATLGDKRAYVKFYKWSCCSIHLYGRPP